jgi:hypothetical protein
MSMGVGSSALGSTLAQQAMGVGGPGSLGNGAAYYRQAADQAVAPGMDPAKGMGMDIKLLDNGVLPAFAPEGIDPLGKQSKNSRRRRFVDSVGPKTPGDGILTSIQSVRDIFMEIESSVQSLVAKKQDFTTVDLMKMQYLVMQLTYVNELSSKVADKTSQGAQTLFRNQG